MQSVVSYISFFFMVWWIWASQVVYNAHFRQADWLHRFLVFLQLMVFCCLAAFTNNFDVSNGLAPNDDDAVIASLKLGEGYDSSQVDAARFRQDRLPRLNAKGISISLALSRLLLLSQYVMGVFYPSFSFRAILTCPQHTVLGYAIRSRPNAKKTALYLRIGALLFSVACYAINAFVVTRSHHDLSKSDEIARVVLWYTPLILEVLIHFVPGRFSSCTAAIYERASSSFTIILGGGGCFVHLIFVRMTLSI